MQQGCCLCPPPCRGPSQGLTWCCEIPTLDLTRESPSIRGIRDLSVAPTRSSDSERTNYRLLARDGGRKPLPEAVESTFLGGGPNTLAKANIDLKDSTLAAFKEMSTAFEIPMRIGILTWTHHREAASIKPIVEREDGTSHTTTGGPGCPNKIELNYLFQSNFTR